MPVFAQTVKDVDAATQVIMSSGWGIFVCGLVVILFLAMFGWIMFVVYESRKENQADKSAMVNRITTLEDRQYRELTGIANSCNQALNNSNATNQKLIPLIEDMREELTDCRRSRERASQ